MSGRVIGRMKKKRYLIKTVFIAATAVAITFFMVIYFFPVSAAQASGEGGLPGGGISRKMTLVPSGPGDYPTVEEKKGTMGGGGGRPSAYTLSNDYMPPVGDQGSQGSCAGWAVGYYNKTYQEARQHSWDPGRKDRHFSPAFLYNQVNGGVDSGTTFYEILDLLKTKGCVDWDEFPYRSSDYRTQPTADQLQAALPYRIQDYAGFWTSPGYNDLSELKDWLASGKPALLGIPVYQSFYDPDGDVIGPPGPGEYMLGGHALTAVGYSDSIGGIRIVNSWGKGWGDSGYAYLSYDFVSNWTWEAWAITDTARDTPVVHVISTDQGRPGTQITIEGTNFGANRGESAVLFGSSAARVQYWNNEKIAATVPVGAGSGVTVVNWAGEASNGQDFDIDPNISTVNPGVAAPGDQVTIYGNSLGGSSGTVRFGSEEGEVVSWSSTQVVAEVPEVKGNIEVWLSVGGCETNKLSFRAVGSVWYLAEGCSNYGFEEFLCIENTEDAAAAVEIIYMTPEGPVEKPPFDIGPMSRVTVSVHEDLPGRDISVRVVSEAKVVVERSMYWQNRVEGHASPGVRAPSTVWYLSEGCTAYGYDTWVLVQNPNNVTANVSVTYMTPEGPQVKEPLEVAANSRRTIHVNEDVPGKDVSMKVEADQGVVVERSMYWDGRRGGHNSEGSATAQGTWYLAEGSTMFGFDEWILVGNPNDAPTTVNIEYMTPDGPVGRDPVIVPANSRRTVHVNEDLEVPEVSARVTADRDVIVERAMYWDTPSGKAGHGALASREATREVFLAEGCTGYGFDTWVLVQNPNGSEVAVELLLMSQGGPQGSIPLNLAPSSRQTVHLNQWLADSDVSVKVSAQAPVIVERAMYWGGMSGGHNAPGVAFK